MDSAPSRCSSSAMRSATRAAQRRGIPYTRITRPARAIGQHGRDHLRRGPPHHRRRRHRHPREAGQAELVAAADQQPAPDQLVADRHGRRRPARPARSWRATGRLAMPAAVEGSRERSARLGHLRPAPLDEPGHGDGRAAGGKRDPVDVERLLHDVQQAGDAGSATRSPGAARPGRRSSRTSGSRSPAARRATSPLAVGAQPGSAKSMYASSATTTQSAGSSSRNADQRLARRPASPVGLLGSHSQTSRARSPRAAAATASRSIARPLWRRPGVTAPPAAADTCA